MMRITGIYDPANEQANALAATTDPAVKQGDMAGFYADCIRADGFGAKKKVDWKLINAAIVARWPKGLLRIKTLAWKLLDEERKE